jgi:S-adenosyl-l-methionine hydroxide adenosyltransferase
MSTFVQLVCDYAPGDLAWAEVFSAFAAHMPEHVRLNFTSVHSFDTIGTGFVVGQLGMSEPNLRPQNLLIFANCAPRKDLKVARVNNEGEGLLFVTLKNGVQIIAVNSGYSLSFIKNDIQEVWTTNAEEQGSQFRSRDYFPQIVALAARDDYTFIQHRIDIATIPDPPKEVIAYVDSFGNMKTTFRSGDEITAGLEAGSRIKVQIGTVVRTATVATGSFSVMEGDLAFAPGSSGHDKRFWELFQRGGSAWIEFGKPSSGTKIVLTPIQ